jgi:hypothetical protein
LGAAAGGSVAPTGCLPDGAAPAGKARRQQGTAGNDAAALPLTVSSASRVLPRSRARAWAACISAAATPCRRAETLHALGVTLASQLAPAPAGQGSCVRDRHFSAHQVMLHWVRWPHSRENMRTTVNIDDDLLAKASKLTGPMDRTAILREGLKALIERESARRLARLGGTQSAIKAAPRRRGGSPA